MIQSITLIVLCHSHQIAVFILNQSQSVYPLTEREVEMNLYSRNDGPKVPIASTFVNAAPAVVPRDWCSSLRAACSAKANCNDRSVILMLLCLLTTANASVAIENVAKIPIITVHRDRPTKWIENQYYKYCILHHKPQHMANIRR